MSLASVVPGPTLEKNDYHRLSWAELAKLDDAEAIFQKGVRMLFGLGVEIDEDACWAFIIEAARRGHSVALAGCFHLGKGTEPDPVRAVELYQQSAARGHPMGSRFFLFRFIFVAALMLEAMVNLGYCYDTNFVVGINHEEAARLYHLAAEQNHCVAQRNLGLCYVSHQQPSRYTLAAACCILHMR
jgi:TPR repeat protein